MKEKSYMVAVSRNDESIKDIKGIMTRLSNNSEVKLKAHKFEEGLNVKVEIDGCEYEVEVFPIDFEIPPLYRAQHLFPDVDVEAVEKANVGLAVVMEFNENPLRSYHAQLKIITALIPDVLAVLDDSSEKILSGRWVELAAESAVPPAPRYIYTVQAVSDSEGGEDCVWLHSHGLNRCGHPDIEVLNSKKETYNNHYNVLETMANRLLEQEEPLQMGEPFYVARVTERIPLMATLIPWQEAIQNYPENMLGGKAEREEAHNGNTCGLFVYPSYVTLLVFRKIRKGVVQHLVMGRLIFADRGAADRIAVEVHFGQLLGAVHIAVVIGVLSFGEEGAFPAGGILKACADVHDVHPDD